MKKQPCISIPKVHESLLYTLSKTELKVYIYLCKNLYSDTWTWEKNNEVFIINKIAKAVNTNWLYVQEALKVLRELNLIIIYEDNSISLNFKNLNKNSSSLQTNKVVRSERKSSSLQTSSLQTNKVVRNRLLNSSLRTNFETEKQDYADNSDTPNNVYNNNFNNNDISKNKNVKNADENEMFLKNLFKNLNQEILNQNPIEILKKWGFLFSENQKLNTDEKYQLRLKKYFSEKEYPKNTIKSAFECVFYSPDNLINNSRASYFSYLLSNPDKIPCNTKNESKSEISEIYNMKMHKSNIRKISELLNLKTGLKIEDQQRAFLDKFLYKVYIYDLGAKNYAREQAIKDAEETTEQIYDKKRDKEIFDRFYTINLSIANNAISELIAITLLLIEKIDFEIIKTEIFNSLKENWNVPALQKYLFADVPEILTDKIMTILDEIYKDDYIIEKE